MIGRVLSHYKILSEISRGCMGLVYRAVDVPRSASWREIRRKPFVITVTQWEHANGGESNQVESIGVAPALATNEKEVSDGE